MQIITGKYWHVTTQVQQITDIYIAGIITRIHLLSKLGCLPAITIEMKNM